MAFEGGSALRSEFFDFEACTDAPLQVVGLGSNAVDWVIQLPHFPVHGGKLRIEGRSRIGGGQVATATAVCARFGLRTRYVSRVAEDDEGRFMLGLLQQDGLELTGFEMIPGGRSQTAFILVDRQGERTILWDRDPRLLYKPGEIRPEWVQQAAILHMDSHDQRAAIEAARLARSAGVKVSLDVDKIQPGVEELLGLGDFVIPTLRFVRELTGISDPEEALLAVQRSIPGFLAASWGERGCLAVWHDKVHLIPAFPARPVDTTGAGDVFHGAFVYSLFQRWPVERCLLFANAAGSLATTRLGSRGGIPTLGRVLELINSRPAGQEA